MNDDDDEDPGEVVGPTVIERIKAGKSCWYVGRGRGRKPDLEDFTHALPFIGDCGALVFSEPMRSRVAVRKAVDWHRRNLQIPVPGLGFIFRLEMVKAGDSSELHRQALFREPTPEWIPPEARPSESRLWGEYAKLGIYQDQSEREVHLLHLGLGGLAAWLWFFQPNGIQPVRIIGTPF